MEKINIRNKAIRYASFLIYHLGLELASDYVKTMSDFIDSKIACFKQVADESIEDFNSIKNLKHGQ